MHSSPFTACAKGSMAPLINAVFLLLLTSLQALALRARHLGRVSLETETLEDAKTDAIESAEKINLIKDKLHLQADGPQDAGESQHAVAKIWMQEVWQADASSKKVDAHNARQATGDAKEDFCAALRAATSAIYAKAKAAAWAEFYKNIDPGGDNAQESKKDVDTAAALLMDTEEMLWERTELLAGEVGGEAIVKFFLEDDAPDNEKTVGRLLVILQMQLDQLKVEKFLSNPDDVIAFERLQSRLSALEWHVAVMQFQELDSHEIDLINPSPLGKNGMYLEMVKWTIEYAKVVQLTVLYNAIVEKIEGMKPPGRNQSKLVLDGFLVALGRSEQQYEMETVISKAIAEFLNAKVSAPEDYRLAKEKLDQAVKGTMEQLQIFDLSIQKSQKAKIANAIKKKKKKEIIAERARLKQRHPFTGGVDDALACNCK